MFPKRKVEIGGKLLFLTLFDEAREARASLKRDDEGLISVEDFV